MATHEYSYLSAIVSFPDGSPRTVCRQHLIIHITSTSHTGAEEQDADGRLSDAVPLSLQIQGSAMGSSLNSCLMSDVSARDKTGKIDRWASPQISTTKNSNLEKPKKARDYPQEIDSSIRSRICQPKNAQASAQNKPPKNRRWTNIGRPIDVPSKAR